MFSDLTFCSERSLFHGRCKKSQHLHIQENTKLLTCTSIKHNYHSQHKSASFTPGEWGKGKVKGAKGCNCKLLSTQTCEWQCASPMFSEKAGFTLSEIACRGSSLQIHADCCTSIAAAVLVTLLLSYWYHNIMISAIQQRKIHQQNVCVCVCVKTLHRKIYWSMDETVKGLATKYLTTA